MTRLRAHDSAEISVMEMYSFSYEILHPIHRKTELVREISHAPEGKQKKHCKHN
jgi:hypothetical protein